MNIHVYYISITYSILVSHGQTFQINRCDSEQVFVSSVGMSAELIRCNNMKRHVFFHNIKIIVA